MTRVDAGRLRKRMTELGMGVTRLAALSGLTRQTVHALLGPGFRPLVPSLEAVAAALGMDPVTLLRAPAGRDSPGPSMARLLADAAAGSPRAFELLPARVIRGCGSASPVLPAATRTQHQLAAAAAEVACSFVRRAALRELVAHHAGRSAANVAFFFVPELMSPERMVEMTPEPMRKHLVFGAFSLDDFSRHL